jgi:HEAT repeat protein
VQPSFPRRAIRFTFVVLPLLFAACTVSTRPPAGPAPVTAAGVPWPVALKSIGYDSDQAPLAALDKAIAEAGADRAKLAAIETQLATLLAAPATTAAGRDGASRRLGLVMAPDPAAASPTLAVLARMLADEMQAESARQALAPVPGAAVDALLLQALGQSRGKVRLGVVETLGVRRTAGAVAGLASLLGDADTALAAAAARALGQIGDAAALAALQRAPVPAAPVVVQAMLDVAGRLPARDAAAVFSEVYANPAVASHLRAAALRGLIDVEPASATERILAAVAGDELIFREAALGAVVAQPGSAVAEQLAARFHSLSPEVQLAVLAALVRKGDAVAVPAVVAALASEKADVRQAALAAIGHLPGDAEIAERLARIAATTEGDEAKTAAASLARLRGSGVAEAIRTGATNAGEVALRVVYLKQLAARNMTEDLPLLWSLRTAMEAKVRIAAVDALGEIAPPGEQRALLDWTLRATDLQEQARAERALVNVTLRQSDEATRAQVVIDAINQGDAAAKILLLPTLQRLGGKAALACAVLHAGHADAAVADAAIDVLVRWADAAGLRPLVTIAEQASRTDARTAAINGAIRQYERARDLRPADRSDVLARLFRVAATTTARKRVIRLLGACKDQTALALAEGLAGDKEIGAEAHYASLAIRANMAGPPVFTASGNAEDLKYLTDGKTDTSWSVPARPGQWLQIDFKVVRPLRMVTLDQTGKWDDLPEHCEMYVTDDPKTPGAVLVQGTEQDRKTVLALPEGVRGRYVLIKYADDHPEGAFWTVSEVIVE